MKIHSVSELVRAIKDSLAAFPPLWVSGQVSNFFAASTGHFYFTLKDAQTQIKAVMFRGANVQLKFRPENGLEVLAYGQLSLYEARGEMQLILEHLEPQGVGSLQLAFEQLKKKLDMEGLFSLERKRPLPMLPQTVGIVTSPTGAVIHDMIQIMTRRFPSIQILLHPVAVQGPKAGQEIALALKTLDQRDDVDVIIVGRGGGSMEDLAAFNEEVVARAIVACRHPVVSAVGHETDFTIADFVADLRAPTPSAAAELVVPVKRELLAAIANLRGRYGRCMEQKMEQSWLLLKQWRAYLRDPKKIWVEKVLKTDHFIMQMITTVQHQVTVTRERLKGLRGRIDLLGPQSVLKRGYSITSLAGSSLPLRCAGDATPGVALEIKLYEGCVNAKVTG